jgi:hypothetical protein
MPFTGRRLPYEPALSRLEGGERTAQEREHVVERGLAHRGQPLVDDLHERIVVDQQ